MEKNNHNLIDDMSHKNLELKIVSNGKDSFNFKTTLHSAYIYMWKLKKITAVFNNPQNGLLPLSHEHIPMSFNFTSRKFDRLLTKIIEMQNIGKI